MCSVDKEEEEKKEKKNQEKKRGYIYMCVVCVCECVCVEKIQQVEDKKNYYFKRFKNEKKIKHDTFWIILYNIHLQSFWL